MSVYKLKVIKNEMVCYGTCFNVDSTHLITACHIIIDDCKTFIHVNNIWEECTIVNQDQRLDLCLLHTDAKIDLHPHSFELITTNCEICSKYFSEENENIQSVDGKIIYHGKSNNSDNEEAIEPINLLDLDPKGSVIRKIRGKEIAMIFQEPMTSLSPVHTIGDQRSEELV